MASTEMATVEKAEFDGLPAWLLRSSTGATATVTERGATIVAWEPKAGRPVIHGYESAAELSAGAGGRSLVSVPWTGAMANNSYVVRGTEYRLESLEKPELGLVYDADFTVTSTGATLGLAYSHPGQAAYPWTFDVRVTFSLDSGAEDEEHLSVRLSVTNTDSVDIPISIGWTPYVNLPGLSRITNLSLEVPARTKILTASNGVPLDGEAAYAGVASPLLIEYIGQQKFNNWFRSLVPDSDGVVATILSDPSSNAELRVTQEPSEAPVLRVNTGDDLERGAREAICLAPMSHFSDSFNRPDSRGSVLVAPGASQEMTVTLSYGG